MRRSILASALLALFAVASWTPGAAASDHTWEVGVLGGLVFPDEELTGSGLNADEEALTGGLRVGYVLHPHWIAFADGMFASFGTGRDYGDATRLALRTGLEAVYPPDSRFQMFLAGSVGYLGTGYDSGDSDKNSFIGAGVGSRWRINDKHQLRWEWRTEDTILEVAEISRDMQTAEVLLGWTYLVGGSSEDADGDGVSDARDQCPNTPRGVKVDRNGCPKDSDGDGVSDDRDECPNTPKGWAVDRNGCPKDSDGDGVADGNDECPDTPRGASVDSKGCPSDSDGDGVYDGIDRCPNTPKGTRVDSRGCKITADSDGDGVSDANDKCPNTPKGTKVDASGCPIVERLFKEGSDQLILEGVNFETNSANLTSGSQATLNRVVKSLKAYPKVRVEIGGHTDSQGADDYNFNLSSLRANSVMEFLKAKGVPASQMTAKGYGETAPIADNGTAAGRAKNRRVELKRK